jgi:hypothetical protein
MSEAVKKSDETLVAMPPTEGYLLVSPASEQPPGRNQHQSTYGRGSQAGDEAIGMDSELPEYPTTDHGTDQPEKQVGKQPEAAAARDLAAQPAGNKTNHDPP